jgi:hypothetical protein
MKKILIILTLSLAVFSCEKEVDSPPINTLTDGQILTIDSLVTMYNGEAIKFDKDVSIYGTITMDESDGNVYKNVYLQEGNTAVNMRLLSSGDLYEGDYIRVNLKGTILNKFSGVMQLDSVDYATNIAVQETGKSITPQVVTIAELNNSFLNTLASEPNDPTYQFEYLSKLVKIENVQFSGGELSGTYADAPGQSSKNIVLEDCDGYQILVRTSGFANFAGDSLAKGNGTITAIVSRYNDEMQIYIRSISEIEMKGDRCAGQILLKDFEDEDLSSGGWTVAQVVGSDTWEVGFFGSNALKIQNYDGSANNACESWYISPEINLTSSPSASMKFDNDTRYNGDQLKLLISTNYSGTGNPNNSTWVDMSAFVSWDPDTGAWGFHDSGVIDLTQFIGNTIFIGFKYTGSDSDGATWELDNISVNG